MRRWLAVIAGAASIVAAASAPASAQVIRTRPFPSLFGSGDPAKSVTQVDFLSFLGAGHESSTTSVAGGALGRTQTENTFGNLVFRGRLAHRGRRTNVGANAAATTAYYGGTREMSPFSISSGANISGALGRYGSFSLSQSVFYSPYYVYGLPTVEVSDAADTETETATNTTDSDPTVDPRVDQRVARLSTRGYSTSAYAGRRVGRDGSLFATYRFNYTDYAPGVSDYVAHAPRAGYRHRISRFASLYASYGLNLYEYRNSAYPWLSSHNVAGGISYDRPLSAWRRTVVGFNASTAVVQDGGLTRFAVNGSARLYRRFGRTWLGGVSYSRGQQVLEGFAQPFFTFSDAVTGSVSGRIVRDIALSGRLTYSHNTFTVQTFENEFDTVYASARLQVPVMWALAAYVEGYYADHDFQRRLGLLEGIPSQVERIGSRFGLTVSVPVFR